MELTRKQLSQAMKQIGRKGGRARKAALTSDRRIAIAKQAANARWNPVKL